MFNFACKLNFEIDGVDYFIERKAKRKKDGVARVDVDFWMIGEDGNPVSLIHDKVRYNLEFTHWKESLDNRSFRFGFSKLIESVSSNL